VLDTALDAVLGLVMAGVVVVAGGDMAVDWGCSRRKLGVHGGSRGAVAWFGRGCHCT
jgi:hypothetical protein